MGKAADSGLSQAERAEQERLEALAALNRAVNNEFPRLRQDVADARAALAQAAAREQALRATLARIQAHLTACELRPGIIPDDGSALADGIWSILHEYQLGVAQPPDPRLATGERLLAKTRMLQRVMRDSVGELGDMDTAPLGSPNSIIKRRVMDWLAEAADEADAAVRAASEEST